MGGEEEAAAAACVNSPILSRLTVTHHSTHITHPTRQRKQVPWCGKTTTTTKNQNKDMSKKTGQQEQRTEEREDPNTWRREKQHMSDMSGIQMQVAEAGKPHVGSSTTERAGPTIPQGARGR